MAAITKGNKVRKLLRSSFTKLYNGICSAIQEGNTEDVRVNFIIFEQEWIKLKEKDEELLLLMFDIETYKDEDFEKEKFTSQDYQKKYELIKLKVQEIESVSIKASDEVRSMVSSHDQIKTLKLPPIKIDMFDGELKNWLPFWGQFEQVHLDESIAPFHKYRILLQSLKDGSRARKVVDSFPVSRDLNNYNAAVEALKERYGREDLLIEVYIRELLAMIISNSKSDDFSLVDMYDKLECHLRFLEILGVTTGKSAAILCPLLESCMPEEFLRVWQRSYISEEVKDANQRLNKFREFIRAEVQNEQRIALAMSKFGMGLANEKPDKSVRRENAKKYNNPVNLPSALGLLTTNETKPACCIFCNQSHNSIDCFKARNMSLDDRLKCVRENKCCYLCLRKSHCSKLCKVKSRCILCDRKHAIIICPNYFHQKFHFDKNTTSDSKSVTDKSHEDYKNVITATNLSCEGNVILPTLKVSLHGNAGRTCVRAIFDTASQRSYILNSTAERMQLEVSGKETLYHSLFGGIKTEKSVHKKYRVNCSNVNNSCNHTFEVLGQDVICGNLNSFPNGPWISEMTTIGMNVVEVLNDTGPIELLIGADLFGTVITGNVKKLSFGTLFGIETVFGWTLSGKVPLVNRRQNETKAMLSTNMLINSMNVSDLWRLDLIGIGDPSIYKTKNEIEIDTKQYFLDTVTVNCEGRYEVNLPWKESCLSLPTNFDLALKRLDTTRKRLENDGCLKSYQNVFDEWLSEGVISKVELVQKGHFLPHRHIIKLNSTTKIRPVFDASAHLKDLPSLNHCLQKGSNLIEEIPPLLHRFRMKRIGVVADIRRAFLQISINPKDRQYLKFLWRDSNNDLIVYQHNRVVFGLTPSPFLLGSVIQYHLEKTREKIVQGNSIYSLTSIDKLLNCFYVDNVVTSFDSIEDVETFMSDAKSVMSEAKFDLRSWEYTDPLCKCEYPTPVLGLIWEKTGDFLQLSTDGMNFDFDKVTKRIVLSAAHRVFDPLGIVSPVTICPKIVMKELWKIKIGWDDEIPKDLKDRFLKWIEQLRYLQQIKVPRWLIGMEKVEHYSIHTFTDASESSYAAVIFLRIESKHGVKVNLVQSKTRISPEKRVTIPRLELLAASIGARLFNSIKRHLDFEYDCYFWTDSSTVLAWLVRHEKWGTFVSNRVDEIKTLTKIEHWHHVPGTMNPADLPSRGCLGKKLAESNWWKGPEWLYKPFSCWPSYSSNCVFDETVISKERKMSASIVMMTTDNCLQNKDWYYKYFSQYNKMVRMMAWLLRFINNTKTFSNVLPKKTKELLFDEIVEAEIRILKLVQKESFNGIKDSKISCLQPFEDHAGLIRLKSKVSNRCDSTDFRFPIILPRNHPVVTRLIKYTHEKECHTGIQGMLAVLRERFWIVGARRAIKPVISKCVVCRRYESKRMEAPTVPLPLDRVREASVFEVVGVDLTGPVYLKNKQKCWICLFTCAVVRAVHLELLLSLSTDDFLLGLRRFVARRGRPSKIYSDQGTNFKGTENLFSHIDWSKVTEFCEVKRISWKFNPPTAPWWGGWWERLIGLTKRLLRKVLKRSTLIYQEMETVLCDIESVLNSRPLTYVAEEKCELIPLSPSVFIQDIRETNLPEVDILESSSSLGSKWKHRMKLKQDFRNRFRSEYLGLLSSRAKCVKLEPVKEGDIVLIGNDNSKRLDWPLANVIELLPGADGVTRVVRLKTANGECLRPIKRIYRLLENQMSFKKVQDLNTSSSPVSLRRRPIKLPKRYCDEAN